MTKYDRLINNYIALVRPIDSSQQAGDWLADCVISCDKLMYLASPPGGKIDGLT